MPLRKLENIIILWFVFIREVASLNRITWLSMSLSVLGNMSVEVMTRLPASKMKLSTSPLSATINTIQRNTVDTIRLSTTAAPLEATINMTVQRNTIEPMQLSTAPLETTTSLDEERNSDDRSGQAPSPRQSLCPSRRRLNGFDSPYLSRPRMKRRGAVSYDKNCAAVEYIRYLGKP